MSRYVSETWFGRRLAKHPPAYRRALDGSPRALPAPSDPPGPQPQSRPELTRPAGMALIITGSVLLLAVSLPLPFLNVKVLGLILIVAGLVKVRAVQRASGWLWRNRHEVMTALDAPRDDPPASRVPLDIMLVTPPGKTRRSLAQRARARRSRARRTPARRGPAPSKPGPGQAAR